MKHKLRLIALLERGPATTGDVASELGVSSDLACAILCGYLKGGLLARVKTKRSSQWRLAA